MNKGIRTFHFHKLLQREGWQDHVAVSVDANGIIQSIESNSKTQADHHLDGLVLPGFQNAHSHAFQYAMAGLAEVHQAGTTADDFWAWREAMYQLALSLNPDQMEAIATMLYSEMLRHGYTHVAEFHYVHHDQNGKPYDNLAELGERLVAAAQQTGINITLIPIFYQKGGFGLAPNDRQRRFISPDIDAYLRLLEASEKATKHYSGANIAIGAHSLRGVDPKDIAQLSRSGPQDLPFHLHISEQLKEVEDSLQYLGKRPVEWLLEHIDLNERYHLVHATHLTEEECLGIAHSKAHVVLCPSTEGNLGDGLFPLKQFQDAGGRWSIGTDSHIGLNPLEELRILDYGQRLTTHQRNTFTRNDQGNTGTFAIEMATLAGRRAMGNESEAFFEVGQPLNAAIFDGSHPLLASAKDSHLLPTLVFSGDARFHQATIVNGQLNVEDGIHRDHEKIAKRFVRVMKELGMR